MKLHTETLARSKIDNFLQQPSSATNHFDIQQSVIHQLLVSAMKTVQDKYNESGDDEGDEGSQNAGDEEEEVEEEGEDEEDAGDDDGSNEGDLNADDADADDADDDDEDVDDDDDEDDNNTNGTSSDKKSTKLRQEAEAYSKNLERRGVIYMSRVPPFMKPNKARTLFEQFGLVTRIYLAEEDSQLRKRRKSNGGNGSKQFTEGWIEFGDKKIAKSVADSLNNSTMGGMKSHFYHDDIWNLKYLKNFKWDYLTEKFAYERRVRENKLKASMMQAKRSNAEFVDLVEKGKQQRHVEDRKRKHSGIDKGSKSEVSKEASMDSNAGKKEVKRTFRQSGGLISNDSQYIDKNLLGSVFGKRKLST